MAIKITRAKPEPTWPYMRMMLVFTGAVMVLSTIVALVETRLEPIVGPIARSIVAYTIGTAVAMYLLAKFGGGR